MDRAETLPKAELLKRVRRFMQDEKRAIPVTEFARLCAVDKSNLYKIFVTDKQPMTEAVQIRVSRVLLALERGEIVQMQVHRKGIVTQYRKDPKVRLARSTKLVLKDGRITVDARVINRNDYSTPTLLEQMED